MPRTPRMPTVDVQTASPAGIWSFLVDSCAVSADGEDRQGFGPSPQVQAMREQMRHLDPVRLVDVMEHAIMIDRRDPYREMRLLWTETPLAVHHHGSHGYAMHFFYDLFRRSTTRHYPPEFWHLVTTTMHPPLLDVVLEELPRMRLPDEAIRPFVEALPLRTLAWTISRLDVNQHGSPFRSVPDHHRLDQLASMMTPRQFHELVEHPRFARDTGVDVLTILVRHAPEPAIDVLVRSTTDLRADEQRTVSLDKVVQALGPQGIEAFQKRQTEALGDRSVPAWLASVQEHLDRRPATVAVDDLIREAEVLRETAAAPVAPVPTVDRRPGAS